MYLMRVIPPKQLKWFMHEFDAVLEKGFHELVGIRLEKKWWRLAQLPPKYGGMGIRSGLRTFGAQHLCSLVKSSCNVGKIVGSWNVDAVARRDTEDWLNNAREEKVDIADLIHRIQARDATAISHHNASLSEILSSQYQYSLVQLCELTEQD